MYESNLIIKAQHKCLKWLCSQVFICLTSIILIIRPTVTNPETATKKPRIIETHQTQGEIIEDKRKEIELEVPVQEKKLIKPETGRLPTR